MSADFDDMTASRGGHSIELRSFGRRHGRKLTTRQQQLMETLLPRLRVDARTLLAVGSPQLPQAPAGLWLEVGFGGGEHLLWQAMHNPDVGLIGCEPFIDGVAKVLGAIDDQNLTNIRLFDDDARVLLRALPPASVDRAFVLFPDPWPKTRHRKRRLVSAPTLALLARVMKPGAELRIGTDIGDYARTMLGAFAGTVAFEWLAQRPADWRVRPADWPQTRYERKALEAGRRCYYLRFQRR